MMATEQIMSEVIAKAVAEATREAIQAMAEAWAEQIHDPRYTGGSRLSRIIWEHENLSGLNIIQLIQLL